MAPGPRRRTPGLRREEVALLAGVGITWYTWLEQGREINASIQVLDAVARTLRLEPAERRHLYVLAEAVPVLVAAAERCTVNEAMTEIVYSLDPLPAIVMNGRFDSLQANDAYLELFRDWHTDPCVHKNGLWALHEVADPEPRTRTYLHPTVGPLTFTVSELQIPSGHPARLIVYTPADDETRKLLPSTRD